MTSRTDIEEYLKTLVGEPSHFTRAYLAFRFPSRPSTQVPHAPLSAQQPPKGVWGRPSQSNPSSSRTSTMSSHANPNSTFSSSSSSSSSSTIKPQDRIEIERAFAGAGGKVYVKKGEDDEPYSVGTNNKNKQDRGTAPSTSSKLSSTTKTIASPSVSNPPRLVASAPPLVPLDKGIPGLPNIPVRNRRSRTAREQMQNIELSEESANEMKEVERSMNNLSADAKGRTIECFCQARRHPLSPFAPICTSCGLVLCRLNKPVRPCPSCHHEPLLEREKLLAHVSKLETQRDLIITRELARRATVIFPQLRPSSHAAHAAHSTPSKPGYALMAGGSAIDRSRIDEAYQSGLTVSGKPFGTPSSSSSFSVPESKILRIDGRTKKAKVQVKSGGHSEVKSVSETSENAGSEESETAWIDEFDDGRIAGQVKGKQGSKVEPKRVYDKTLDEEKRTFINVTLKPDDRPVWIAEVPRVKESPATLSKAESGKHKHQAKVVPGARIVEPKSKKRKGRKNEALAREVAVHHDDEAEPSTVEESEGQKEVDGS